jgi:ERCC4-related helicase
LSVRVVDYVRLVQITMWFVPLKPVIEIQPKEFYSIVEPLFKSIESEQLYMTLQKKVQRMSLFWKSQAERDKMNKGRDVPR